MQIQYSGMKTQEKQCFSTLIDGEHILYSKTKKYINLFKAFDIYFINEEDNRSLPLYIKDTGTKSRYLNLINLNTKCE